MAPRNTAQPLHHASYLTRHRDSLHPRGGAAGDAKGGLPDLEEFRQQFEHRLIGIAILRLRPDSDFQHGRALGQSLDTLDAIIRAIGRHPDSQQEPIWTVLAAGQRGALLNRRRDRCNAG